MLLIVLPLLSLVSTVLGSNYCVKQYFDLNMMQDDFKEHQLIYPKLNEKLLGDAHCYVGAVSMSEMTPLLKKLVQGEA